MPNKLKAFLQGLLGEEAKEMLEFFGGVPDAPDLCALVLCESCSVTDLGVTPPLDDPEDY